MGEFKIKGFLTDEQFTTVLLHINKLRGIDLCQYRRNFVYRHLNFRLQETGLNNHLDYINFIKENPKEIDNFLDALSINVTHFFRDPEVFGIFKEKVLKELLERKKNTERGLIRVWSAGCASGQEAYSLAIMFNEALGGNAECVLRIWATDVDSDALERAKKAEYESKDLKEIDKKLLEKYFEPVYNNRYGLNPEIKRMVRFDKHNLITDEGLKFMDVIFCRNVMIYFNRQQQQVLLNKFYNSLNAKGYLVTAKVESIWDKDCFVPIDPLQKIYQKVH